MSLNGPLEILKYAKQLMWFKLFIPVAAVSYGDVQILVNYQVM